MKNTESKQEKDTLRKLLSCITAIKAFKDRFDKKLNLRKLFTLLHVPIGERDRYIRIFLEFQDLFQSVLSGYELKVIKKADESYLKPQKIEKTKKPRVNYHKNGNNNKKKDIPDKIILNKSDAIFWNDIIYSFKNVRRGKGFNLHQNTTELAKSLKELRATHPYLFFSNGNGLVYPSKLGLELGSKINGYIKVNRDFGELFLLGSEIIIKKK